MKKITALLLSLAMVLPLAACTTSDGGGGGSADEPVEVIVFAAASLEASLTEIADAYQEAAPNVKLTFTFDSSGTLRTQIKEGAVCDLFISAGQSQMNDLEAGENEDGADFVYSDTRVDFVENKVVLAVPDNSPAGITEFADLATDKLSLLCIGNDDVPVGSYSLEILDTLGIDIAQLEADGKVTYATNVTEVANQVKEGAVDCGIIYATDAKTYELTVVDEAEEGMCSQVIYPAAVMKSSSGEAAEAAAQAFLDYLRTDESAVAVLEEVGFTVL